MTGDAVAEPVVDGPRLVVDLGAVHRSVSSAVLGGGYGRVRTWLNLQVPPDYGRVDPGRHLRSEAAGLPSPVIGVMTAAPVARFSRTRTGDCLVVATVGVGHALAAAATRPRPAPEAGGCARRPGPGTINALVVLAVPLAPAGLVNALQTAVEAKAQALAAARVPAANANGFATGTATDAICVACPPGRGEAFAGPSTRIGGDVGRAVYEAVLAGIALASDAGGLPAGGIDP